MPELASLGRVFRSAAPVELTESETEYVVRCVKHIMDGYVVLDFTISNTIEEQVIILDSAADSIALFWWCWCWCCFFLFLSFVEYANFSTGSNVYVFKAGVNHNAPSPPPYMR